MSRAISNSRDGFKAAAIGAAFNAGAAAGCLMINVPEPMRGSGLAIGSVMTLTCLAIMCLHKLRLNSLGAPVFSPRIPQ